MPAPEAIEARVDQLDWTDLRAQLDERGFAITEPVLGASEDEFAEALAADGVLPTWRLGAFDDVETTLRHSVARLKSSPELPVRDHIRGFVFNPETGELREV